ncbi:MAG TPA: hypothetical protein VG737_04035, partial [Cyclobacteriaceae bacterium]|nr:hypothetical protein [Cyclobacteriaceae bacterium]
ISFERASPDGIDLVHRSLRSMKRIFVLPALCILIACSTNKKVATVPPPPLLDENTFKITEISTDKTYGYTESNPIRVGNGPKNARRYLNALAGPKGQKITYTRTGSCCTFKTPLGYGGIGQLDKYKVTWTGQTAPVILYLNMFESGVLKSPVGLTLAVIKPTATPKTTRKTIPGKSVKPPGSRTTASKN